MPKSLYMKIVTMFCLVNRIINQLLLSPNDLQICGHTTRMTYGPTVEGSKREEVDYRDVLHPYTYINNCA